MQQSQAACRKWCKKLLFERRSEGRRCRPACRVGLQLGKLQITRADYRNPKNCRQPTGGSQDYTALCTGQPAPIVHGLAAWQLVQRSQAYGQLGHQCPCTQVVPSQEALPICQSMSQGTVVLSLRFSPCGLGLIIDKASTNTKNERNTVTSSVKLSFVFPQGICTRPLYATQSANNVVFTGPPQKIVLHWSTSSPNKVYMFGRIWKAAGTLLQKCHAGAWPAKSCCNLHGQIYSIPK